MLITNQYLSVHDNTITLSIYFVFICVQVEINSDIFHFIMCKLVFVHQLHFFLFSTTTTTRNFSELNLSFSGLHIHGNSRDDLQLDGIADNNSQTNSVPKEDFNKKGE